MLKFCLDQIKEKKPIVQCITNIVTANDCANALLAIGASATMAHHPREAEEIQTGCQALVCNFGAIADFEAMVSALKAANRCDHPVVIDPVGVAGSTYRREMLFELADAGQFTCIRGNASEIKALVGDRNLIAGVDGIADQTQNERERTEAAAMELALRMHCMVVASGACDIITDGTAVYYEEGGTDLFSRITGSGCMSSGLLAAFLTAGPSLDAVRACCGYIARCGEIAAEQTREAGAGTVTFRDKFIDQIYRNSL